MRPPSLLSSPSSEYVSTFLLIFLQKELAQLRVSKVSAAPQVKLARIRVRIPIVNLLLGCQKGHRQGADCDQREEKRPSPRWPQEEAYSCWLEIQEDQSFQEETHQAWEHKKNCETTKEGEQFQTEKVRLGCLRRPSDHRSRDACPSPLNAVVKS